METKQPQTPPAEARENIMGTMEINPLLIKLSVPMMIYTPSFRSWSGIVFQCQLYHDLLQAVPCTRCIMSCNYLMIRKLFSKE